jgi:hypothetical protein
MVGNIDGVVYALRMVLHPLQITNLNGVGFYPQLRLSGLIQSFTLVSHLSKHRNQAYSRSVFFAFTCHDIACSFFQGRIVAVMDKWTIGVSSTFDSRLVLATLVLV